MMMIAAAAVTLGVARRSDAVVFVQTDRVSYTGAVAYFGDGATGRANAISGTNALSISSVANRDASIYFSQGMTGKADSNIFTTAWFYTTAANTNGYAKDDTRGNNYYSGSGNPTNTRIGLVQLYDSDGSTDASMTSQFSDETAGVYHTLNFSAFSSTLSTSDTAGGTYASDLTRVWNGKSNAIAQSDRGDMLFWSIAMTLGGLNGTQANGTGPVTATGEATSVIGSFYALLHNTNPTDLTARGYYAVALDFNLNNWAYAQGDAALNGNFRSSMFVGDALPPITTGGTGLDTGGTGGYRWHGRDRWNRRHRHGNRNRHGN
jgi:hypothetical protein